MLWYGMVWYGMVWYGMVWYGMVLHTLHTYGVLLCYVTTVYSVKCSKPVKYGMRPDGCPQITPRLVIGSKGLRGKGVARLNCAMAIELYGKLWQSPKM